MAMLWALESDRLELIYSYCIHKMRFKSNFHRHQMGQQPRPLDKKIDVIQHEY